MTTYAVRFDFDTGESPTEQWLNRLEDSLGHTVSARADRGFSVTVWLDHADDSVRAVEEAYRRLGMLNGRKDFGDLIGTAAQTGADYEAAAFGPSLPVIVGAADVAETLHVSRQRVHQLTKTAAFPQPIARIKLGPLWDRDAVLAFAEQWDRKPGRPPIRVADRKSG